MGDAVLKGITWGHSRGLTPLLAASQRFSELHLGIEIEWKKRSLQQFADFPIEKLTEHYDLLIIDHPWVGCAAATKCVLDLNDYLPKKFMDDQLANSTGYSHLSYCYDNGQWALAIDAATPTASYRADLLQLNGQVVPETWSDVLALADKGRVATPAIPIDLLMNFYSFCIAHGTAPFQHGDEIVSQATGIAAIETMKELYCRLDREMFSCNPIAVAELMSSTDNYWYCPFSYGYSNYSRNGYARCLLHYTNVVLVNGNRLRTTIGGTGLAVSSFSRHKEWAIAFCKMIATGEFQRTFYVQHGGQPAHRSAWLDEDANRLTHGYFKNVLPLMEEGYVRPRYNGYLHFQDTAGHPLQRCLMENGDAGKTLEEMNRFYRQSLSHEKTMLSL